MHCAHDSFRETSCVDRIYKKKTGPITGPRFPESSRKLRFPDYVTKAQDGGKVADGTYYSQKRTDHE